MKKILIITFYFPPLSGGASLRMWRFCKSLANKLEIEVLTIKSPKRSNEIDFNLLSKIKNIKIHRTNRFKLNKVWRFISKLKINPRIFMPEANFGWVLHAIREGNKILKKSRFDYLLGVYPTFSSMLVSYKLSKFNKIPLIIDLHDLFYDTLKHDLPISLYRHFYSHLEGKILSHASIVSVITPNFREIITEKHKLPREKFVIVPNTVDLKEFKSIKSSKKQEFIISYVGFIEEYHLEGIILLIEALNLLKKEFINYNIKFRLIGHIKPRMKKKILEMDTFKVTEILGFVNKNKSNLFMMESDILYLTLSPYHRYMLELRTTIPSKLIEYIGCGKPILAYLPKGTSQQLITENNLGLVLTKFNSIDLSILIRQLFENEELRNSLSENALKLAQKYDSKVIYEEFFRKTIIGNK